MPQPPFAQYPGFSNVAADLAGLAAHDSPNLPNGFQVYVIAEQETYQLDTMDPLTTYSPLIVARGASAGTGKWYRRSRAYVVGNFTLWACEFGGAGGGSTTNLVGGFTPGQIQSSNANGPDIVLDFAAIVPVDHHSVTDVCCDMAGNIWVTEQVHPHDPIHAQGTTFKIALKDCLKSGPANPTVTLSANAALPVDSLWEWVAFDKQNNFWMVYGTHGTNGICTLLKYDQAMIGQTGSPLPSVQITLNTPGSATSDATCVIFDAQGNAWISASNFPSFCGIVCMLSPDQLRVSNAALTPAVIWTGSNFPTGDQGPLTFGPTGLMWMGDVTNVRAFDARSPVSGNPAPVIVLSCSLFNFAFGLAFDAHGNLWVYNAADPLLYRIPASQLTASGTVVPDVVLSQTVLSSGSSITFPNNPERSGLLPSGVPIVQ